jgi:hypothetical protein
VTSIADRGAARTSRLVRALLLSPFVILIASATRLLLVGNYDTTTATTIAAAGGVVGTLLGTIVPLLPPLLPIVCLVVAVIRKWSVLLFTILATALVSTTYTPLSEARKNAWYSFYHEFLVRARSLDWASVWHSWPLAAICAAIGAILVFWDPPPGLAVDANRPIVSIIMLVLRLPISLVVAAICALVALLSQNLYSVPRDLAAALSQDEYRGDFNSATVSTIVRRPWVPAEEITLKSGSIIVGYTFSTKDKWFIVLKEYDRTINYIFADDVASRRVCSLEKSDQTAKPAPLITLQGVNIAKTPLCRDVR